jgi:hypothetical protein
MRLTVEKNPRSKQETAGIKKCDVCNKEEFLLQPRRWDVCLCCERKQGYKEGRRVAPKQEKKQCFINYCDSCSKVFEVKSRNLYKQKHCSSKCAGEKLKGRPPTNKIWHDKKERTKSYYQKYYHNDINKKIRMIYRNRLKKVLKTQLTRKKGKYKSVAKTEELLGCTLEFFVQYIESQFTPEMTWENHGHTTWHIDHIIPISTFDLTDEEQLKKACHYTNMRPLKASENFQKYNRTPEEYSAWLIEKSEKNKT